jgi:hypothetical protein
VISEIRTELSENLRGRDHFGGTGVDVKKILKEVMIKWSENERTDLI